MTKYFLEKVFKYMFIFIGVVQSERISKHAGLASVEDYNTLVVAPLDGS